MPASEAIAEPQIPIRWTFFSCAIGLFLSRPLEKAQQRCAHQVQLRLDTKSEGHIAARRMAGAETNRDRPLKPVQHPQNDLVQYAVLLSRSHTVQHLAKDDPGDSCEFSRQDHLSQ